jgi:hypothetical protein
MLREVEQMSGESAILECLEPEQRRFLRDRARARECSVEVVLREIVAEVATATPPIDDRDMPGKAPGTSYRLPENPKSIMDLAGIISDPEVTGENFDDYLYGRAGT